MELTGRRAFLRSLLISTATVSLRVANSVVTAQSLPAEISDETFWKMIAEMSESDGDFRFENFLSNELGYQYVLSPLHVATLPLDTSSTFIRTFSSSGGGFAGGLRGPYRFQSTLSSMAGILSEFKAGRVRSIQDVRILSQ